MNTCKEIAYILANILGVFHIPFRSSSPLGKLRNLLSKYITGPWAPGDSAIMMQFADVLHNMSLTVLLPWQQTVFQTLPDILVFSGHLWSSILMFANGASSA